MFALTFAGLSSIVLSASAALALETPRYETEVKEEEFELRRYATYLVAETRVEAEFDEAGNLGFRRLADFIFGKNKSQIKIAMTAPVSQSEAPSEKIAMTAPVGLQGESGSFLITFSMPSSYTLETLPLPIDPEVTIRQIEPYRAAVIVYSGTWGEDRYRAKREKLRAWIQSKGWELDGEPIFARYDPPWMPWFLRTNEVIWKLKQ